MKISLAFAFFLPFISTTAFGQQDYDPPPISSPSPTNAEYVIIQSPLAAKWQFLLDRYDGYVYRLVKTTSGDVSWEKTPVLDRPLKHASKKPRYQMFTSGLAARHTFLLNTETGMTWRLYEITVRGEKHVVWQKFKE